MDAIHINTKLDSDTLYLPQIRPLIGKSVEIIVQELSPSGEPLANGRNPQRDDWKAALAGLAGLDIDWDAYRRQREFEIHNAGEDAR